MKRSSGLGSVTAKGARFWARGPRPERISLGVYDTHEEADDVRAAAVDELARADRTRVAGVTLRAFATRVLAEREHELPRSRRSDAYRWTYIERAPFVDDPIATITAPAVDRWARDLLRQLPRTAKVIFGLLRVLFVTAQREGLVASNPCAAVRLRPPPRPHEPWTWLTLDEQRAVLTCTAIPEADRLLIAFALGTGLREGEQCSLRLGDLHLESARPHVVVRYGSKNAATKSGKIRRVPLFGIALAAARRWLELLPSYAPRNPREWAFPGPLGGHRDPGHPLRRRSGEDGDKTDKFQEALELAGVVADARHDGRPVRWHDLRHSFAASLVSGSWGDPWRLEDLRDVMGHATITITQRYAHLATERVHELVGRTGGLRMGDAAQSPIAFGAADQASRALPSPLALPSGRNSGPGAIPRGYVSSHPLFTHRAAVDGLRALAHGRLAEAEQVARGIAGAVLEEPLVRLALLVREQGPGVDGAHLVELFEAALDGAETERRQA